MIRNLGLSDKNEKEKKEEKHVNKCPICKLGNGALCTEHYILCKDFKWLRNYINNLDKFDNNTVYIIQSAITERISLIINKLEVINGRLDIEGYLAKSSCSVYSERMLKEILILEKAKTMVIKEINNGSK